MEKWFEKDFNPESAGWKKGKTPFANFDGKLPEAGGCSNPVCGCGDPGKTLWDKEVLLMRRVFDLPPLKEGYRYRMLVGGSSHVGKGDGYCVYINGRNIVENKSYGGRGSGGEPDGASITSDFFKEFKGGHVVVAATSFLRQNQQSHKIQGHFNVWFQQQKMPPISIDLVKKSATLMLMTCAEWQELQNPESETDPDEGKFKLDKAVAGDWTALGNVASIEEFAPGKKLSKPAFASLSLKDDGTSTNPLIMWSGSILMDLERSQALKMVTKTVDGKDYLFVEAGGFAEKNGPDWKSPLCVMKRK